MAVPLEALVGTAEERMMSLTPVMTLNSSSSLASSDANTEGTLPWSSMCGSRLPWR